MTEQEINNLIDSKIGKVKMSQLPEATQTSGLYSIGYTGNQSVKYKANLLQGDPLTVRKTYQTEVEALADKNPIDPTTSLPLTVGQFVSIVDDGEKNGIYRIGSIDGSGTMSLELQGKLGDLTGYTKTGGSTKTTKYIDETKANHGYDSSPKTLKEVDDDLAQLESNLTGVLSSDLGVNYLPHYIPTGDFSVGDKILYDVYVPTAKFFHAILTVKKGDTFVLNARGGARPRIYCFVDINDIVLEVSDSSPDILIEHVITAPADGKLIFNSFDTVVPSDDTVKMGLKVGYSRLDDIENQIAENIDSVDDLKTAERNASKGQLATLTLGATATPPDLSNFGLTLTFGGTVFVFHQNKRYTINSGTVVDLSPLIESTGRMVLLDTKTNDLYVSNQSTTHLGIKDNSILIAIVYQNMGKWLMNINCPYTIDGEIYNPHGEPTMDDFEVGISYRSFVTLESINTANGNYIETDKASMTPMIPSSSLIKATVEDGFNFHRVVLYDNEGAFIGTVLKNSQSVSSSDTADSSFVRLKVVKDDSTAFTPEELELSKPTITRLQQEFLESRNVSDKEIQLYKNGMEVFPVSPSKDDLLPYSFSTNRLLTNYPESNFAGIDTPESDFTHATVTAEDVYILFDAMVAEHPEYISREQIGLSTNGVPMYVYDFNPTRPSTGSESIKPFPKVILGGAIHGGENMAVYTLYHFFFNMVTNWRDSETLEYLRHSVNFRVIPVQNPEDFTNKQYAGIEGINLNREFDYRWSESDDSGSTPFQRIESRNLRDFLFENTDALFHTDCHVRGGYPIDDNKLIWVATNGEQIIPTSAMIEYLTREWLIKYPSLQIAKGEFAGYTTSELGAKTIRSYTQHVVGIPSFLWEGFQSSTTLNEYQNEDVVNVNLQSLGQYIVSILKYYQSK